MKDIASNFCKANPRWIAFTALHGCSNLTRRTRVDNVVNEVRDRQTQPSHDTGWHLTQETRVTNVVNDAVACT